MEKEIKPIAMPGIHSRFLDFFKKQEISKQSKILDVGAGHGAFTKKLYDLGYNVEACDMFPEHFYFDKVVCKQADVTKGLPYEDGTFNYAIAMEITEHINGHETLFREVNRILKPGGKLFVSTPNILSIKSRWRYLMSGFFYSFEPLELRNYNGLQHVASLTADQYNYIGIKCGFLPVQIHTDKYQNTSKALMFLYPIMRLHGWVKRIKPIHNSIRLLLGRILFLVFEKQK